MEASIRNDGIRSMEQIDKVVEQSLLFDFYGDLLKENQRQIFEDYVLNDLSLSEIADEANMSRQGVHDIIKRCTKQLKDYESKLKLIEKFKLARDKIEEIKKLADDINLTGASVSAELIHNLADDILEML